MARKKQVGKEARSAKGAGVRRAAKKTSKRAAGDLVDHDLMEALSHRLRATILSILTERVASPNEMAAETDEDLSMVSYHVKVLRERNVVVLDHTVPRRGAVEHFYRAAEPTLLPQGTWDNLTPAMRKGVSACIVRKFVDDALASMQAGVFDDSPGELSWTPLILDQLGVDEVGQLARDFLEAVLAVQAKASKRLPRGKGATKGMSATVFLASFLSARSPEDGMKASATKRR